MYSYTKKPYTLPFLYSIDISYLSRFANIACPKTSQKDAKRNECIRELISKINWLIHHPYRHVSKRGVLYYCMSCLKADTMSFKNDGPHSFMNSKYTFFVAVSKFFFYIRFQAFQIDKQIYFNSLFHVYILIIMLAYAPASC